LIKELATGAPLYHFRKRPWW